jgi:hypothetical protein
MAPKYLSYYQRAAQASRPPERPTFPWWRALTNAWGIFGLIIFIGLVLRLIDGAADWMARQQAAFSTARAIRPQAEMPEHPPSQSPFK